jgi:hypothetical protein
VIYAQRSNDFGYPVVDAAARLGIPECFQPATVGLAPRTSSPGCAR